MRAVVSKEEQLSIAQIKPISSLSPTQRRSRRNSRQSEGSLYRRSEKRPSAASSRNHLKVRRRDLIPFDYGTTKPWDLLADQRRLGAVPPELGKPGIDRYRELAIGRSRLIYQLRDNTIYIFLLVVDHRHDFQVSLARRLLDPTTSDVPAPSDG